MPHESQRHTPSLLIGCAFCSQVEPCVTARLGDHRSKTHRAVAATGISLLGSDGSTEGMANSNGYTADILRVYRGTFIHSTQQTAVEILEDALLGVDVKGKVRQISKISTSFAVFVPI